MSKALYRIGRACFAHQWLVISIWLLAIVAGAGRPGDRTRTAKEHAA